MILYLKKNYVGKDENKLDDEFDLSMPGRPSSIGSIHPITKIMNSAIEIFESLKFECS